MPGSFSFSDTLVNSGRMGHFNAARSLSDGSSFQYDASGNMTQQTEMRGIMELNNLIQRCLLSNDDVIISVEKLNELKPLLIQALTEKGMFVTIIDRAPIFDKDTMLHAFYQNCEFPSYFGFNWNALLDCLTDFEWKSAKGYVLIFQDPSILQWETPLVLEQLVEFIGYAGERWKTRGVPFKMLIPMTTSPVTQK